MGAFINPAIKSMISSELKVCWTVPCFCENFIARYLFLKAWGISDIEKIFQTDKLKRENGNTGCVVLYSILCSVHTDNSPL